MTTKEAFRLGGTEALKNTSIVTAVILLIAFIMETRGDFANGFIFFVHHVTNNRTLGMIVTVFASEFLLGGRAGKKIIVDQKHFMRIGIENTLMAIVVYMAYFAILGFTMQEEMRLSARDFILIVAGAGLFALIPLFVISVWTAFRLSKYVNG